MTVSINQVSTVELPLGTPLAYVGEDGTLFLWPGGVGNGPLIGMSVRDWEQLKLSGDMAIRSQRMKLDRYAACEGHDGEDDE